MELDVKMIEAFNALHKDVQILKEQISALTKGTAPASEVERLEAENKELRKRNARLDGGNLDKDVYDIVVDTLNNMVDGKTIHWRDWPGSVPMANAIAKQLQKTFNKKLAFANSNFFDEAVTAFLAMELPEDFGPDCYIEFDRNAAEVGTWPTGTNLFSADQIRIIFKRCFDKAFAATSGGDVPTASANYDVPQEFLEWTLHKRPEGPSSISLDCAWTAGVKHTKEQIRKSIGGL
jgi:hypothetical protein